MWRSSYSPGRPSSSAAVRVVVVHDIKEEEGERQKCRKLKVMKRERESEVDGEVDGERESHSTCA